MWSLNEILGFLSSCKGRKVRYRRGIGKEERRGYFEE